MLKVFLVETRCIANPNVFIEEALASVSPKTDFMTHKHFKYFLPNTHRSSPKQM